MKILHLTDLHYSSKTKHKIDSIVKEFNKFVKEKNIKPDIIVFTGDLVFSGKDIEDFNNAYQEVILEISNKLNIDKKHIIFCCGNHDVHRDQEMKTITKELFAVTSEKEIEEFFQDEKQVAESLKNIQNYNDFAIGHYNSLSISSPELDEISEFYSIHTRLIKGTKYNFVTINTSWRCNDSKTDSGTLLYPIQILDKVISKTKNLENKILLHHHPFSDFKYFNQIEIKKRILDNFLICMNGHTHNLENSVFFNKNEGMVNITSEASFCNISKLEKTGFSIVDLDLDNMKVSLSNYRYDGDIYYDYGTSKEIEIPVETVRREIINFNWKVFDLYNNESEKLSKLFVTYESGKKFEDLFSIPNIKNTSETSFKTVANKGKAQKISHEKLINRSNFIVYGKDKCGKSIIAYNTYLELLKNFSENQILPILIDDGIKDFDLHQILRDKFNVNKAKAEEILNNIHIKLIIDDYEKLDENIKPLISDHFDNHKNHSYLITTGETILSEYKEIKIDSTRAEIAFIHDLTEKEITNITTLVVSSDKEIVTDVVKKIKLTLKQLNIPYNYWTISLFVWIFKANSKKQFNDNFELIELYIDNILDKEFLINDTNFKASFDDLKGFLSYLAIHLIKDFESENYKVTFPQLIEIISKYKIEYPKFVVEENQLFKLLCDKSILKNENNFYTFRLKGVFEYFVAFYLKDDETLRNQIIENDSHYLSYSNELELIAGFNKRDKEFVEKIFKKTHTFYDSINQGYKSIGNEDINFQNRSQHLIVKLDEYRTGVSKLLKKEFVNPNSLLINETFNSDIKTKKIYEQIDINSENLERLLFILCRVYRNSNLKDSEFTNEVFEFILESSCNLCFFLIDNEYQDVDENNEFLKVFSKMIPLVIQGFLNNSVSQSNLEQIYLNKIKELKQQKEENQLKLFIIYFLLIDLDLKNNKNYIDDLIEVIDNNFIKNAIIFKLISFVVFNKIISSATSDFLITRLKNLYKELGYKETQIDKFIVGLQRDLLVNKSKFKNT